MLDSVSQPRGNLLCCPVSTSSSGDLSSSGSVGIVLPQKQQVCMFAVHVLRMSGILHVTMQRGEWCFHCVLDRSEAMPKLDSAHYY